MGRSGNEPDNSVQSSVDRFREEFPWTEVSILEAHLAFAHANAVVTTMLSRRYNDLGLSIARFNALRLLYHSESGRLRLSDLGVRLGITSASVTRLVDGLVRDGWVQRTTDEADKRGTYVEFGSKGRERFAALLPTVLTAWSDLWAGLNADEREHLSRLNKKLRASLLKRSGADAELKLQEY